MLLRRVLERKDEGSIAVMAAVVAPVVLLVIALALATLVWAASENETQLSADEAAVQTAASALLLDLPQLVAPPSTEALYPELQDRVPVSLPPYTTLPTLSPCETVGNPVGAVDGLLRNNSLLSALLSLNPLRSLLNFESLGNVQALTSEVTGLATGLPEVSAALASLPSTCTALTGTPLLPAAPMPSFNQACQVAEDAMRESGPYATRFYSGSDSEQVPTCTNTRVRTGFATGSQLVGFGDSSVGVGGALELEVPIGYPQVRDALAPAGVRLDSALPNTLCPQVDVEVDQPVREPVFDRSSTPNGRASAKRVVKNAVVVPVFNGLGIKAATVPVTGLSGGGSVSGSVTFPAQNLNPALLEVRNGTLALLDGVEAQVNTLTSALPVTQLNGTLAAVSAASGGVLPAPSLSANLGTVNLLKCLKDTVRQIFDPPGSEVPPTVQEIFEAAAASGDPVQLIQVGAQPCAGSNTATDAFTCVQSVAGGAAADTLGRVTGVYPVPFFDVTPVLLQDLGDGNFTALPVHAAQASGAFRATLVRSDDRYVSGP